MKANMPFKTQPIRNMKTGMEDTKKRTPRLVNVKSYNLDALVEFALDNNYIEGAKYELAKGIVKGVIEAQRALVKMGNAVSIDAWVKYEPRLRGSVDAIKRQITGDNQIIVGVTALKELKLALDDFSFRCIDDDLKPKDEIPAIEYLYSAGHEDEHDAMYEGAAFALKGTTLPTTIYQLLPANQNRQFAAPPFPNRSGSRHSVGHEMCGKECAGARIVKRIVPGSPGTEPLKAVLQPERLHKIAQRIGRQTRISGAGVDERIDPGAEPRHRSHLGQHRAFRGTVVRYQRRSAKAIRNFRPQIRDFRCGSQFAAKFRVAPHCARREGSVPDVEKRLPAGLGENDTVLYLHQTQLPRFVGPSLHRAGRLEIQRRPDHRSPPPKSRQASLYSIFAEARSSEMNAASTFPRAA